VENFEITLSENPFPFMIVKNFYDENELNLIWEELDFYTKPGKFLDASGYGGIPNKTNSKALLLDELYPKKYRNISNILTANRKLFKCGVLDKFSEIHGCCSIANKSNHDITKVRYYHNDEYYDPHTDCAYHFLAFSYFYKEPKKFTGGDLIFPKYDFKSPCENNSMFIFPGWVEHGVDKVTIENSDYFDGLGRYCISNFFSCVEKKIKTNENVLKV
jgi:hypothetical protein